MNGLERDGLVVRVPSEDDRRVARVELTSAGRASADRILPDHLSRLSKMMAGLSRSEQKLLVRLLRKVHAGVAAVRDEDGDSE